VDLVPVALILAVYVVSSSACYGWWVSGDPRRTRPSVSERLLVAGDGSLAAGAVPLLVVGVAADVFSLGLAAGRLGTFGAGEAAFMIVAVAAPAMLFLLGVLAARGRRAPALGGFVIVVSAYAVLVGVALFYGDPGPSAIARATAGLLPAVLLLLGFIRRETPTTYGEPVQ
jgi:hypothetical protein